MCWATKRIKKFFRLLSLSFSNITNLKFQIIDIGELVWNIFFIPPNKLIILFSSHIYLALIGFPKCWNGKFRFWEKGYSILFLKVARNKALIGKIVIEKYIIPSPLSIIKLLESIRSKSTCLLRLIQQLLRLILVWDSSLNWPIERLKFFCIFPTSALHDYKELKEIVGKNTRRVYFTTAYPILCSVKCTRLCLLEFVNSISSNRFEGISGIPELHCTIL